MSSPAVGNDDVPGGSTATLRNLPRSREEAGDRMWGGVKEFTERKREKFHSGVLVISREQEERENRRERKKKCK